MELNENTTYKSDGKTYCQIQFNSYSSANQTFGAIDELITSWLGIIGNDSIVAWLDSTRLDLTRLGLTWLDLTYLTIVSSFQFEPTQSDEQYVIRQIRKPRKKKLQHIFRLNFYSFVIVFSIFSIFRGHFNPINVRSIPFEPNSKK